MLSCVGTRRMGVYPMSYYELKRVIATLVLCGWGTGNTSIALVGKMVAMGTVFDPDAARRCYSYSFE
jgi:hypothetical protein